MTIDEERRAVDSVVDRLRRRFPGLPDDLVVTTVALIAVTFRDARIRDYIPLLVEREARDLLAHAKLV